MIDRVFFLLHYEKIRHLPVLENGKVVGIVTDRDMYKALGPKSRSKKSEIVSGKTALHVNPRKVRNIVRRGVITSEPDEFAAKAASMMANKKVGPLPVTRVRCLSCQLTGCTCVKFQREPV